MSRGQSGVSVSRNPSSYNRLYECIGNQRVSRHVDDLFGTERAVSLHECLPGLNPKPREAAILEELAKETKQLGGTYVLPFTFRNAAGTRTSHKLNFVSRHFRGYSKMKDIMAGENSAHDEDVPSLTCSPTAASSQLLFCLARRFGKLRESLLDSFASQEVSFATIYEAHVADQTYVAKTIAKY